jgi:hypothetical protein
MESFESNPDEELLQLKELQESMSNFNDTIGDIRTIVDTNATCTSQAMNTAINTTISTSQSTGSLSGLNEGERD